VALTDRTYTVVTIEGDGSGPELMEAARRVLASCQERYGFALIEEPVEAGAALYERLGVNMTEEDLIRCAQADAVLKAPVGLPHVRAPDGTEAGLLGGTLRRGLQLYANIRPMKLRPGVVSPLAGYGPGRIDYVIVRENVEGLYASRGRGLVSERGDVAADALVVTRQGTERVARVAFQMAQGRRPTG
jgi:3-isopropylmalate dehydrogenase